MCEEVVHTTVQSSIHWPQSPFHYCSQRGPRWLAFAAFLWCAKMAQQGLKMDHNPLFGLLL